MNHPTDSQFNLFANLANPNRVDMNKPPIVDDNSTVLRDTPFVAASDRGSNASSSRHSSRHSSRVSKRKLDPAPPSPKRYRPSSAGSARSTNTEAKKLGLLMELKKMRMQGVHLTREYSTADSLEDIEFEFSRQKMNMDTVNSVALMRDTMRLIITGIELGNNRMGPFLNLDGWSGTVTADMTRYDHCLERIYKMYFRRGSINPIMELGFLLIGSMFMHHVKAKFTGPPPVQRNVPFEVPQQQQQPRQTFARNVAPRPTMRPPKSNPFAAPPIPTPMAAVVGSLPRMGMPRAPPISSQQQQSQPDIQELVEEKMTTTLPPASPKVIDTTITKQKKAATLTVEKQGATLNFDDMSDEDIG